MITDMRSLFSLFVMLALLAAPARAFHTARMGLDSADAAQLMMTANPPLPMMRMSPGTWKLTLQPAYFSGSPIQVEDADPGTVTSGDFNGFGGGVGFSYAWSERWGAYVIAQGAASSGNFSFGRFDNCAGDCFSFTVSNVKSSFNIAMFGIMHQVLPGDDDKRLSLQAFTGPMITRTKTSQTFVAVTGVIGSAPDDDFDMELDDFQFGWHAGAQAGYNLGKKFKINPYLLAAFPLGDSCATYDVPAIRATNPNGNPLSSQSDLACGGSVDNSPPATPRSVEVGLDEFEFTGGINLIYKPWGLTVNLTAPFLKKIDSDEGADIFLLTFSLPFGNFLK